MRTLKFRGMANGEWRYATIDSPEWPQFLTTVDHETIGQHLFAGVHGTSVYEHDIVRVEGYQDMYTIKWNWSLALFGLYCWADEDDLLSEKDWRYYWISCADAPLFTDAMRPTCEVVGDLWHYAHLLPKQTTNDKERETQP